MGGRRNDFERVQGIELQVQGGLDKLVDFDYVGDSAQGR